MPLTDSAIKTAKPKEKPYKLSDSHGLYLEVTPTGSKLWRLKYRLAGKEKKLAIGAYPIIGLQQARQRRDEARQQLADGVDPSEQRKAAKQSQRAEGLTFESVAREWYAYNAPRWAESTAYKAKLYLENDLLPGIGARPIAAITRPDLVELVRKVEARGTLNAAGKIRQWLHQIFRYALARGVVENNPATDLDVVAAPAKAVRHHPHVAFAELPELLEKLEAAKLHNLTRWAIRLLVLTAVRPGELRAAPWAEFDLDAATWTIPSERMKARRPHVVPLPRQAVAILRQLQEATGSYALLFPGQQNAERPMSENTINKALRLIGYEGRQTGHGFRHLLSTELNGRGYNRDWIERQLAHGDADEIRDTYNHATYIEQRREMMQAWADSIDALCAGANVVSIKRKA
ncbi:tyrosine-type recombinase/integrase [Pseudomonas aeruginosa]|uniref:tyrosine-type recombinase/integrase n=1 Tax=Pseudomonas aeruginosa TaxID=287 RepID=UPI000B48A38F|nr:integrase arm-type DNA-binding domain-containing protein [Pseudomonas aeruginosa]MCU9103443.1 integrase arm-type DNA-binding domain-containing protein [Pseudomonas aeruginosa]MCU9247161.1 integrase arm-type DNA-binding domain-containing protein [Pseudomonas aeruginosa]MCU9300722.1 integrase arm-type DNA-binding domain-containing protein [Pseudomonas aeruginosa]MCU9506563.1 integrase arm-type DNA-binding domain-containing protein [Pseudomonas aeruginosa]OWJ26604.1 integrase [Pseudomonas aeru